MADVGTAPAFVGRVRELAELSAILTGAVAGRGRLALVGGEAGIGKTRLAERVVAEARQRGFADSWGNARGGEGAPAFWPWIQVLRGDATAHTTAIDGLLSELAGSGPDAPPSQADDAVEARFRVFDAVFAVLREASTTQPLLVVLEDLHWADRASGLLLGFLEPRLREIRVVVLGTYRDLELVEGPVADGLQAPSAGTVRLRLSGLSEPETAELVTAAAGTRLKPAVARAIHERSGGHPLFARELARLLAVRDQLDASGLSVVPHAIPRSIRDVLEQHLARLSPDCRALLVHASVLGQRFGVETLRRMTGMQPEVIARLVGEAMGASILEGGMDGRQGFAHALIREVLQSGAPAGERERLHLLAAEALEETMGDAALAEIAHHLRLSRADISRAVSYSLRAADLATRQLAFEEAIAHLEEALAVLGSGAADQAERGELLVALGRATNRTGDAEGARATFLDAATAARASDHSELLATAALGFGTLFQYAGFSGIDRTCIELLDEALGAMRPEPSALRIRVLVRLAQELYYIDRERFEVLAREIVATGPHLADAAARARALMVRHTMSLGRPEVAERRGLIDLAIRASEEANDLEFALTCRADRVADSFELGDIGAVEAEVAFASRRAEELRLPSWRWFPALWRATLTMLEGRLDRAEQLATEALQIGEARGQQALDQYGIQLLHIRREQDRFAELEPLIRAAIEQYPYLASYRCVLSLLEAEGGRDAAARAELQRLAADGFAAIPNDYNFTISASLAAETCALLRDAETAATLFERLEPFSELYVNVGFGGLCYGSIARFLALLEDARDRWAAAEHYFGMAVERNARIGSAPGVARTRYEHARMLLRRRMPGDEERAAGLLGQAGSIARELGLVELQRKIGELRPSAPAASAGTANVFRREGEIWTVAHRGREIRLKDSKGLRDIAVLLARPGIEVHVLDLVAAQEGSDRASLAGTATYGGDALLDEQARTAYRARAEDLRDQIEDAERFGDPARAESARSELDALTRELGAAYGLGGRARRAGDPVERARKAVSARIRDAVRRIGDEHPHLATHLDRSVRTGVFCAYEPEEPTIWTL